MVEVLTGRKIPVLTHVPHFAYMDPKPAAAPSPCPSPAAFSSPVLRLIKCQCWAVGRLPPLYPRGLGTLATRHRELQLTFFPQKREFCVSPSNLLLQEKFPFIAPGSTMCLCSEICSKASTSHFQRSNIFQAKKR